MSTREIGEKGLIEHERRWLVHDFDHAVLHGQPIHILQGYFGVEGLQSLRVRIVNRKEAVITSKRGAGEKRIERETSIPLDAAEILYGALQYTLEKHRYRIHGWELDIFLGTLNRVVFLEYETKDGVFPPLPPWIRSATEVTEFFTNLQLAQLAHRLGANASESVREHVRSLAQASSPQAVFKTVDWEPNCS